MSSPSPKKRHKPAQVLSSVSSSSSASPVVKRSTYDSLENGHQKKKNVVQVDITQLVRNSSKYAVPVGVAVMVIVQLTMAVRLRSTRQWVSELQDVVTELQKNQKECEVVSSPTVVEQKLMMPIKKHWWRREEKRVVLGSAGEDGSRERNLEERNVVVEKPKERLRHSMQNKEGQVIQTKEIVAKDEKSREHQTDIFQYETEQDFLLNGKSVPSAQLLASWKAMKASTLSNFTDVGFEEVFLGPSFTVDDFISYFLDKEAPFSIGRYQEEEVGDSELETSAWVPTTTTSESQESNGSLLGASTSLRRGDEPTFSKRRLIKYRHPVKNPMAPPTAIAHKLQRVLRYGQHGVVLETRTEVMDVPKTDCFYVMDRIIMDRVLVEPTSSTGKKKKGEQIPAVMVSARFDIRFIKPTMFRGIIERSTKAEFKEWFKGYAEMISRAARHETQTVEEEVQEEESKEKEEEELKEEEGSVANKTHDFVQVQGQKLGELVRRLELHKRAKAVRTHVKGGIHSSVSRLRLGKGVSIIQAHVRSSVELLVNDTEF